MGEGWWANDVYVSRGKEVIWLAAVTGDPLPRTRPIRVSSQVVQLTRSGRHLRGAQEASSRAVFFFQCACHLSLFSFDIHCVNDLL